MKRLSLVLLLILFLLVGCSGQEVPEPEVIPPVDPQHEPVQVTLAGKAYTMPILAETLLRDGWKFETDDSITVAPKQYLSKKYLRNEAQVLEVNVYNPSENAIEMRQGYISLVGGQNRVSLYDELSDISLLDSLTIESSVEDFTKALGEPSAISESNINRTFVYDLSDLEVVSVVQRKSDEALMWIYVESYLIP